MWEPFVKCTRPFLLIFACSVLITWGRHRLAQVIQAGQGRKQSHQSEKLLIRNSEMTLYLQFYRYRFALKFHRNIWMKYLNSIRRLSSCQYWIRRSSFKIYSEHLGKCLPPLLYLDRVFPDPGLASSRSSASHDVPGYQCSVPPLPWVWALSLNTRYNTLQK